MNSVAEAFVEDSRDRQVRELAGLRQSPVEYGLPADPELISARIGDMSILSGIEPGLPACSPISHGSAMKMAFAAFKGGMLGFAGADRPTRLRIGSAADTGLSRLTHLHGTYTEVIHSSHGRCMLAG